MRRSTASHEIQVSGIPIEIVRKDIKNLHPSVMPPNGRVRVSVPKHLNDDRVRAAVVTKLDWIRKRQRVMEAQPRQTQREMVEGESHYFMGKRYRLEVVERYGKHKIELKTGAKLQLFVSPDTTAANRRLVLNEWYREQLKAQIPLLLIKWEAIVKRHANDWGVKKMKTRWGSCNITQKRVWLNLELAKKPPECLEYVLVHELVHLHERYHNDRFKQLMTKFLPNWESSRKLLNQGPLGHDDWDC
ncbi:MAG: M48 family metallopeptidase [Opitutaceae bacterium]|nr:M48 family metallopeptidase [Opitutaceae bacterium]